MRIDLGESGDAVFVLLLPLESLIEIRSSRRGRHVTPNNVGRAASRLAIDLIPVSEALRRRRRSRANPRYAYPFSADFGGQIIRGGDRRRHRNRHLVGKPGTAYTGIHLLDCVGNETCGILLP